MIRLTPRRATRTITSLLLVALTAPLFATASPQKEGVADSTVTSANYKLAARFTQGKMDKMAFDLAVEPRWLEDGGRFWYVYETSTGKNWYLVDAARRNKSPLFDNAKMAADLTLMTRDPYDARHLPIDTIKFVAGETAIEFDVTSSQDEERPNNGADDQDTNGTQGRRKGRGGEGRTDKKVHHFRYDLRAQALTEIKDYEKEPARPSWAAISPDGQWVVFSREHNLFMMDKANYEEYLAKDKAKEEERGEEEEEEAEQEQEGESDIDPDIEEIQLTTDGERYYSYGNVRGRGQTDDEKEKNRGKRQPVNITWSNDSFKFALVRADRRAVGDLWVLHNTAQPRPKLETYRYDMPGEKSVTQSEIHVFDIKTHVQVKVQTERFVDQALSILQDPGRQFQVNRSISTGDETPPAMWLARGNRKVYFTRTSRDLKKIDIAVADTGTGEVTTLIEERLNTYIELQSLYLLETGEMVHWSERDGWGHYYLFDPDGNLVRQLTSGEYSGRRIVGVDEQARMLYFVSNGREKDEDPYYTHLYRVGLDTGTPELLSPGNFNHIVSMNENNTYFIDNYSRVDTTPVASVHNSRGETLMQLEKADLSSLFAAGYKYPSTFEAKADDGITDLYGVMYKPFDLDETKKYPVIAYVYPGPQTESVAKSFNTQAMNVALAQFGFIVITVGNRGGHPARSKWYHNYGYGNLRDYGLADKKVTIEQLADRHPFIDIDRVGIYGHSGGGFMSTAAMLVYPDFFKVAVSSAGNHENNIYNRRWSEKHHGVKEVVDDDGNVSFEYAIDRNSELAANLKGKLLLTTGDVDNNVHPANTITMAEALIRANKRFDFFMFPGQRHGFGDMNNYWFWLRADYFSKHLLGGAVTSVDMLELNREEEQGGNLAGGRGQGR